jgi:6-phosphogluconolactonase
MKTRSEATGLALALLFVAGVTSMSEAKTFVYVSNAQDGNIDAFVMDTTTGALNPIGKVEAAKLVMPMAVSPNKKHLYAVVRSQPTRVLTYAIDPATGALSQRASAALPDSMPYVSTDQTGRFLFTASYGGDKLAVSPIGENGLVESEAIQVIPTGRNAHSILPDRSNKFVYAATSAPTRCCSSRSTARRESSRPMSLPRSALKQVMVRATWPCRLTTRIFMC